MNKSSVPTLTPEAFVAREAQGPVLDVRTPAEFASGHVANAVNVDVMAADFDDRIDALVMSGALTKEAPVYLYCRSGNRSGKAASRLQQMGFAEPYNVGGFEALRAAGAPTAS